MDAIRKTFSIFKRGRHSRRRHSLERAQTEDSQEDKSQRAQKRRSRRDSSEGAVGGTTDLNRKIIVMGPPKCGKSAIIQQFLHDTFTPRYKRTIEEMYVEEFESNGVHLTMNILDTSGENEFPVMRALSVSSGDAFILVYDICDASSFEAVQNIRDEILESKASSSVPIVVVGNKLDLAETHRQMEATTTESVVTVDWENGFVEASAKDGTNITKIFQEVLRQSKVKYNLSPAMKLRRKRRRSAPPPSTRTRATSSARGSPAPSTPSHRPSPVTPRDSPAAVTPRRTPSPATPRFRPTPPATPRYHPSPPDIPRYRPSASGTPRLHSAGQGRGRPRGSKRNTCTVS